MLEGLSLTRRFGERLAVDQLSIRVRPGEILGLLGPNGAGKTTTLSLLCGALLPDAGEVRLDGHRLGAGASPAKRRLGLVPQDPALYEPLSAAENLRFFGALQGLSGAALRRACQDALAQAGLEDRAQEPVSGFSGGMRRRLNLAVGVLHDPDVLLLDEPTVGVDPQSRSLLFDAVRAIRARGKAILHSSHQLEEAERLCDRVVVLDQGRVVAEGSPGEVAGRAISPSHLAVELFGAADPAWKAEMEALDGVSAVAVEGTRLLATLGDVAAGGAALLSYLSARGARVRRLGTEGGRLEDAFLALTGRDPRDG